MRNRVNKKGFSTVDVLIGGMIGAIAIAGYMGYSRYQFNATRLLNQKVIAEHHASEITELFQAMGAAGTKRYLAEKGFHCEVVNLEDQGEIVRPDPIAHIADPTPFGSDGVNRSYEVRVANLKTLASPRKCQRISDGLGENEALLVIAKVSWGPKREHEVVLSTPLTEPETNVCPVRTDDTEETFRLSDIQTLLGPLGFPSNHLIQGTVHGAYYAELVCALAGYDGWKSFAEERMSGRFAFRSPNGWQTTSGSRNATGLKEVICEKKILPGCENTCPATYATRYGAGRFRNGDHFMRTLASTRYHNFCLFTNNGECIHSNGVSYSYIGTTYGPDLSYHDDTAKRMCELRGYQRVDSMQVGSFSSPSDDSVATFDRPRDNFNVVRGNSGNNRLLHQVRCSEPKYPDCLNWWKGPIVIDIPGGCYHVNHDGESDNTSSRNLKLCSKEFDLTDYVSAEDLANKTIRFEFNWWGYPGMARDYSDEAKSSTSAPRQPCSAPTKGFQIDGRPIDLEGKLKVTGGTPADVNLSISDRTLFERNYTSWNNTKYLFLGIDYDPANNHRVKLTNAGNGWGECSRNGAPAGTCAACLSNIRVTIEP